MGVLLHVVFKVMFPASSRSLLLMVEQLSPEEAYEIAAVKNLHLEVMSSFQVVLLSSLIFLRLNQNYGHVLHLLIAHRVCESCFPNSGLLISPLFVNFEVAEWSLYCRI